MSVITLSTKDADSILSYLREQLSEEDKDWKEYQDDKAEIIKKYEETPIVRMFIDKKEIDDACEEVEKRHDNNIKRLLKFIELLTVGSEQ